MIGVEHNRTGFRLARHLTVRRHFNAVIRRIAHHMSQRILDQFQNLPVKLGFGPQHLQVDLLAEFNGKIAYDAGKLRPRVADGLHARLHHAFLQFRRYMVEALQRRGKSAVFLAAQNLHQLIARQHQLAGDHHKVFQAGQRSHGWIGWLPPDSFTACSSAGAISCFWLLVDPRRAP